MFTIMDAAPGYGKAFIVVSHRFHVWARTDDQGEAQRIASDLNRRREEGWK